MTLNARNLRPFWFVGADWDGVDQTDRFVRGGVWENGCQGRYINLMKSVAEGDRIAIKSAYVRRDANGLPFDNRCHSVSVMAIKAVGVVTGNVGDGRRLRVDWTPILSVLDFVQNLEKL